MISGAFSHGREWPAQHVAPPLAAAGLGADVRPLSLRTVSRGAVGPRQWGLWLLAARAGLGRRRLPPAGRKGGGTPRPFPGLAGRAAGCGSRPGFLGLLPRVAGAAERDPLAVVPGGSGWDDARGGLAAPAGADGAVPGRHRRVQGVGGDLGRPGAGCRPAVSLRTSRDPAQAGSRAGRGRGLLRQHPADAGSGRVPAVRAPLDARRSATGAVRP